MTLLKELQRGCSHVPAVWGRHLNSSPSTFHTHLLPKETPLPNLHEPKHPLLCSEEQPCSRCLIPRYVAAQPVLQGCSAMFGFVLVVFPWSPSASCWCPARAVTPRLRPSPAWVPLGGAHDQPEELRVAR